MGNPHLNKFLPRLNQEDIDNPSKPVVTNETEDDIKTFQQEKKSRTDDITTEFYKTLKEEVTLFQITEQHKTLPNYF